jgi:Urocanase Rossmann-like domain
VQSRDLQYKTIRAYKGLTDQREDWGGRLVLFCGPHCVLDGNLVAVSIAGGTTLAIDTDAAEMKAAMRSGYLDFVVNSLDEALRALKNQVRQKRPLSVGLISDVTLTLTEMVARGVLPDLEVAYPSHGERDAALLSAFESFLEWRKVSDTEQKEDGLSQTNNMWRLGNLYYVAASEASQLRVIDEALLEVIPSEDLVRRRWIERVPRYLREARSGGRWIWLNQQELASVTGRGLSPVQQT